MAEVKYGDEKLLTSDEFIKAAKENADKNFQVQKETAQKVWDATYGALDEQYAAAETAAGNAKQRNLINADTEYQRQELKYGAEQEALAASGLSGSGMNEYRRAQAYQQKREDTQASYADYDKAMREAAYARDQGKLTADLNKAQTEANAEIQYNDTLTNLSEKELGYDTLEKQAIDSSYGTYIAGINDGSMTLDQIKADSYWSKLSEDQRKTVERAWSVKQIKSKIDNGDDIETIHSSYEYLELDEDGRNQVDGYYAQVEAGKTEDANAALGSYIEMAMSGVPIDTIKAIAQANGHFKALDGAAAWNSVADEASRYAKASKDSENKQTVQDMIDRGDTREEIEASDAYKDLDTETKAEVDKVINKNEEQVQANIDSIVESFSDVQSLDEVRSILKGEAVPESERAVIISRWQEKNVSEAEKGIKSGTLTSEKLIQNIKNGLYGDKNASVATEYVKDLLSDINGSDVDVFDVLDVKNDLSAFKGIVTNEWWNRIQTTIGDKIYRLSSNGKYNLETGVKWSYNGDKKEAVNDYENEALNVLFPDADRGNVATINGVRYGKDGSGNWWKIK